MITCYAVPEIWCVTDVIAMFPFGLFLPFYPPNCMKNENFKKNKKNLEITSLYTSVPKIMIIFYIAPELWHVTDVIVVPPPLTLCKK